MEHGNGGQDNQPSQDFSSTQSRTARLRRDSHPDQQRRFEHA